MTPIAETLTCKHCGKTFSKLELQIYCGNCFGCTGCERYVCPNCEGDIVVKAVRKIGEARS